ncbi:DUF4097 family beta strand repeat-containing protein [Brevibacillus brevis]|uniref:DUF4097 family beta strand repeat-containing protein n=1 Tax=Brevibacillus brevis TaxID=1393 RepID=A0ABY9T3B5_BREBE|nr:DUF4097 family beta strand repeat-containing protein [Brevibacillus brevis]WNC13422.1 DUF4097 family beta strand repeat-containing protein [Brevibacillus brevis]
MGKGKTILGASLILIGISYFAYQTMGVSIFQREVANVDKKWVIQPNDIKNLDVQGGSTDLQVEFIPSENDESYILVEGTALGDVAQKIESAQIANHTLSLDLASDEWHFLSFDTRERTLLVTVALPEEKMLDTVALRLRSGDGSYDHIKAKRVQIEAASGNMDISGIAAQDIRIESSSGNINASEIQGTTRIASKSGSVSVDQLSGDSVVDSTSGDVDIVQKTPANADITARSGSVTFTVAENYAGRYQLHANSGEIEAPVAKGETEDVVKIQTNSGDITVNESE